PQSACGPPAMNAVAKGRAGFRAYRLSGPRATQEPEGGGWEPSARMRAFRSQLRARAGHQGWAFCRERQHRLKSGGFAVSDAESPLDFPARRGPEPSGRSEMDQLGPKTGRVQPRRPPFVEFRDSLL